MNVLPDKFVEMLAAMSGHEDLARVLAESESPVSIRLNPEKSLSEKIPDDIERVPWEPLGLYLPRRPQFTFIPALYDGRFYVQDASSMIIGEVVRRIVRDAARPLAYLDACAAPGGKTLSALSSLPSGSFVLANEFEPERASALVENLQRWGTGNYAVSRMDARALSSVGEIFDIVAADVPCSGEGMMRKNATAVAQWSPGLVDECADLQFQIVESVWKTLRPGGFLIYSTCTFNTQENEGNVRRIRDSLGAMPVDLSLTSFPGVLPGVDADIPCARFIPGKVKGEGQFIAVLRKPDDAPSLTPKLKTPKNGVLLPPWLEGDYAGLRNAKDELYAVKTEYLTLVTHLMSKLNVIVPGLHVAVPKGKDLMPAHALATSTALKEDAFPVVEVGYSDAMGFLRGEALRLGEEIPKGYVLISHRGCRLGWAKNIGNRANNLVPSARRIRSPHVPDAEPALF